MPEAQAFVSAWFASALRKICLMVTVDFAYFISEARRVR